MGFGDYRHRLTIQTPAESTGDGYNVTTTTWADYATVWAQLDTASPREQTQGPKDRQQQEITIRTHYISGVTAKMRLTGGGRTYQVVGVENPGLMNRELVLTCSEMTT